MDKSPIDLTTPLGKRIAERLEAEIMIWLTTVAPDGTPQPNPVWFLWDGSSLLVYSHKRAARLRNLRQNPHVALNFDSRDQGESDVHGERGLPRQVRRGDQGHRLGGREVRRAVFGSASHHPGESAELLRPRRPTDGEKTAFFPVTSVWRGVDLT